MRSWSFLFEKFDWALLISTTALSCIGLVAIYGISLSQEQETLFLFYKQFAGIVLGLAAVGALTWLDFRQLKALGFPLYLFGLILLILVLFAGHTVRAQQGWFKFGNLSFQPVEIAKATLIIYLAALFSRASRGRLNWKMFGLSGAATAFYALLVFLQPDFGSGLVLIGLWAGLCLFIGLPRRAWIILPTLLITVGLFVWSFALLPYQRDRITSFIYPAQDARGASYNAIQARIAIGSGGWFGKGLGEGSQARLRFLPEASTDFLFSVIGEELGFFGVVISLGLYGVVFYRLRRIAEESQDKYAGLVIVGIGSALIIHVFVNAGMNVGIVPITGIPMPLLSAGASSLVTTFLLIGMAEGVAVRRKNLVPADPS